MNRNLSFSGGTEYFLKTAMHIRSEGRNSVLMRRV